MAYYYVNKNAQPAGEHEVHTSTCDHLPSTWNLQPLGNFNSCREALASARNYYTKVDGCFYCCNPCHTR